jgi:hypothetical protein
MFTSLRWVARIISTRVIIVTIYFRIITTSFAVASIISTKVIIIAIYRFSVTTRRFATMIIGTIISIIAHNIRIFTSF